MQTQQFRKKAEVNPANIYDCKVEELPSTLDGFFDYATIFHWEVQKIEKKLLKGLSEL